MNTTQNTNEYIVLTHLVDEQYNHIYTIEYRLINEPLYFCDGYNTPQTIREAEFNERIKDGTYTQIKTRHAAEVWIKPN